jgi:hypothetical protein
MARLLTASATTGWLDWIHGELWLFPTGLLRVPLGVIATLLHGLRPTVNQESPVWRNFDERTFEALLASKRNRWIPREQIKKAYLHRGLSADRLRLECVDQQTMKFLWLPVDSAWEPLQSTLHTWLGDRLVID